MIFNFKQKNEGFTLIELLVVIAIIGLLSSVVLASLNSARVKARDAVRKQTLKQVQTALELYYDKYSTYPVTAGTVCSGGDYWCRDSIDNGNTPIANWIPGLQEFIQLPQNPKPYGVQGWPYHYYSPSKDKYWLMVGLENATDKDTCGGGAIYPWVDDNSVNACSMWGPNLYVRTIQ